MVHPTSALLLSALGLNNKKCRVVQAQVWAFGAKILPPGGRTIALSSPAKRLPGGIGARFGRRDPTICCRDVIQHISYCPLPLEFRIGRHDYRQTWTVLLLRMMRMTDLLQIQRQLPRTHTQTLPFLFTPKPLSCRIYPQKLTLL